MIDSVVDIDLIQLSGKYLGEITVCRDSDSEVSESGKVKVRIWRAVRALLWCLIF